MSSSLPLGMGDSLVSSSIKDYVSFSLQGGNNMLSARLMVSAFIIMLYSIYFGKSLD